jgi:hypothetical protein
MEPSTGSAWGRPQNLDMIIVDIVRTKARTVDFRAHHQHARPSDGTNHIVTPDDVSLNQ